MEEEGVLNDFVYYKEVVPHCPDVMSQELAQNPKELTKKNTLKSTEKGGN